MHVDSVCNILINISTALFASLIAAADAAAALSSFDKKMNEKANKVDDDEKVKKPNNCCFSKNLTHYHNVEYICRVGTTVRSTIDNW